MGTPMRVHAKIVYKFRRIFFAANVNSEEQYKALKSSTVIRNYSIIIIIIIIIIINAYTTGPRGDKKC